MNEKRWILWSSLFILSIIWCCSFAISYVSLADVAYANGIDYPWAWMWPLLLDAFMSISSLDVIRRELNHEPTWSAWLIVIAVTILSTGFNITRAFPTPLSWCVHALPPVICFLSFEVVMGLLRSTIGKVSPGCQPISGDVVTNAGDVVAGDRDVVTCCQGDSEVVKSVVKDDTRNIIWQFYQENPRVSYSEIAEKIGVSRQAVRASVMRMRINGELPQEV